MRLKVIPSKICSNGVLLQILIFGVIMLLVVESCLLESARSFSVIYWPLVSALILLASISGGSRFLENKCLCRLGDLSFIIFMIHQLVISYSTYILKKIIHLDNTFLFVSFALILTIVLSAVVERMFLNPITSWLTKKN